MKFSRDFLAAPIFLRVVVGLVASSMARASLAVVAILCLITAQASATDVKRERLEVQGHRGARWVRPENTMSAFRYAVGVGVDTLELDLHATRDNVLVVAHDHFINPDICLDAKGKKITKQILLRSLTLAEVQELDCGSLINPKFPRQLAQERERIPEFEVLLKWLKNETGENAKNVRLNIELKTERDHPEYAPDPKTFVILVVALLKKYEMVSRAVLQSFDFRTLKEMRAIEPSIPIAVLMDERPFSIHNLMDKPHSLTAIVKAQKADIFSPRYDWLTAEDVSAMHAMGVKVIPWTVNNEEDWRRLSAMGVDGIITDDPAALIEFRKKIRTVLSK